MNLGLILWLMFAALIIFGIWIIFDLRQIDNIRGILERQRDFDEDIMDWTRDIERRLQALEDKFQDQDFN